MVYFEISKLSTYILEFHLQVFQEAGACDWSGPGDSHLRLFIAFLGSVITSPHYLFYASLFEA